MKTAHEIGDVRLIDKMSREQLQDYWMELKDARYDSYYYREMLEKIRKMNPNLIWPPEEEVRSIEEEALRIALWEENWDKINIERVRKGGSNYSIFKNERMWVEKEPEVRTFPAQLR